jgi:hypothetical protein
MRDVFRYFQNGGAAAVLERAKNEAHSLFPDLLGMLDAKWHA